MQTLKQALAPLTTHMECAKPSQELQEGPEPESLLCSSAGHNHTASQEDREYVPCAREPRKDP